MQSNSSLIKSIVNTSHLLKFFICFIIGLTVVFAIDPLDPTTVSSPFLLGIVLMGLSLRQSTSLVVVVSLVYSVLTIFALIQFHEYMASKVHVGPHPLFWLFQRSGLFLVLCGLAIYLAHHRTEAERVLSRLRTILSKLPAPVILSDVSGIIVYANDAVTPILHRTPTHMIGSSYFDFFHTEAMKGESIRSYFELFEADTNGNYEVEVSPFGDASKMSAQIISIGTGPNRVLITVLQNVEKGHHQSGLVAHGARLPANFSPHA
jgi:PAS domain-containing protein